MRGGRRFTVRFVESAKPGRYSDGSNGLILQVVASGARTWLQRLTIGGRRREFGLGGYPLVSLAEARDVAFDNRRKLRAGENPFKRARRVEATPTFKAVALQWLEVKAKEWKAGSKTEAQCRGRLERYVFPVLGNLDITDVDARAVERTLRPLWDDQLPTGKKVRQLLTGVMSRAEALGYVRSNPVPAASALLPTKKAGPKRGFRALANFRMVPDAIRAIFNSTATPVSKLALEFAILTAGRSGEIRGARWSEINMDKALWTVPAERMKNDKEHLVPLSSRSLEILREAKRLRGSAGFVFPAPRSGMELSDATLTKLLRTAGIDSTVHGFRSSFRDWCGHNGVRRDVAEACLAHTTSQNATEAAYYRTTLVEQRRSVVERWAAFTCGESETDNVVSIRAG